MVASSPSSARPEVHYRKTRPTRLTLKAIHAVFSIIGFLIFTWLLSIVVEWICMTLFWPEEGSQHSQRMLRQELTYLHDGFKTSVIGESPAATAFDVASQVKHYVFEWTHIISFYESLKIPPPDDASDARIAVARITQLFNDYFQALINTTVLYAVRVTVATLSLPSFFLIGAAALIDGLVQREKRIYSGSIERGWVYHHVKPWIRPSIFTTWFFYLGIPFAIHPNLIFGPANVIFGLAVFITASLFKKHI